MVIKYCVSVLHPLLYNLLDNNFLENIENIENIKKYKNYHDIFDIFENIMIFSNPVQNAPEVAIFRLKF